MPELGARRQMRQMRRMLLICAGVAIALAGSQVYWLGAEGGMAPMLAALVSLGLAVALVVLAVMTRTAKHEIAMQPEVRKIKQNTVCDLAVEDATVIGNSQLDDYFSSIKDELGQVDRLVGDAVGNLVASFRYISKLTRFHQEILLAIEETATPAGSEMLKLLRREMAIAGQIEQELDAAVTSLQFGDLVTQLLGHTMHRVEDLSAALQRIDRQSVLRESSDSDHKLQRIHGGISRVVTAANAANRRKPVVQHGMQTGEIELF